MTSDGVPLRMYWTWSQSVMVAVEEARERELNEETTAPEECVPENTFT